MLVKAAGSQIEIRNNFGISSRSQLMGSFCSLSNVISDPGCSVSVIPVIMSRYYPTMRMGHIFVYLEIKPGYGAFMNDFQILRSTISSPDGIRLFVAQTDNMETSSCLISPPKVKNLDLKIQQFLHICLCMSNLLQAVGEFNGNYIVIVASMGVKSTPSSDTLEDYLHSAPETVDSDSEIIEGPSQISLNCPISLKRINAPVKGHLCKHLQCFDFENYDSINSRRPSWRYPHCNQHTCFTDIRIDKKILEILKDIGRNITKVVVSSDGSWSAVTEIDDNEKDEDMASDFRQKESRRPECDPLVADINYINESSVHVANYLSIRWAPNPSEPQISGATASNPNNIHLSPVLTDAIIPAPYPEAVTSHANMHHASSGLHTQNPLSSILPLQQFQYGNPTVRDEHGRLASTTQHVNGIPGAFQSLPEQSPASVLQQMSQNYINTLISNITSATPQVSSAAFLDTSGLSTAPFNGGSQQQFSRSHSNQIGVSQIASSSSQHCPGMQNAGSWSPTQPENMYQGPIAGSRSRRMSQLPNQSLGPIQAYIQSITNFPQPQVHQRGPQSGIYQETGTTCTHQAMSHSLGSIQSSMQFHTNFLQPQVHQQVQQNAICLGTEAIDDRQATNNTLSPIHSLMQSHANVPLPQVRQRGSQSGITQTTEAITSLPSVNHNTGQATNHTLSSIYSLMQSYANVPMPQVHQRGSQNGITQTTVAVSSLPSVNHNSGPIQSSMQLNANFLQPRVHPRGSEIGNGHATRAIGSQHSHFTVAAQRNAISSVIRPVEASRIISPFTTNSAGHRVSSQEGNSVPVRRHDLYDLAEQNWRPTSRMRGALTGQAYSDALSQYIIRPNQQAQAAQPFVSVTTPLSSIITSMQAHMDDRAAQNPGPMN